MADATLMFDLGALGAVATAFGAIGAIVVGVTKFITRDVSRDISDVRRDGADVEHKLKNQIARIDAIEHLRTGDIERIVKLEAAQTSFDKAVERVERGQEKLAETINDRFDILADAIRGIRTVPKG